MLNHFITMRILAGAAGSRRRSSAFGTAGAQGGMAGAGSSAMNGKRTIS